MVCGAFLGWLGAVEITLVAHVLNGALSIGMLLINRAVAATGRPPLADVRLPYAVAVAIATILYTTELVRLF